MSSNSISSSISSQKNTSQFSLLNCDEVSLPPRSELTSTQPKIQAEKSVKNAANRRSKGKERQEKTTGSSDENTSVSSQSSTDSETVSESSGDGCSIPTVHVRVITASQQPTAKAKNSGPKPKPKALDLFSGKGSVKCALEARGYEVISLDIDPRFSPTIACDILRWDFEGDGYHRGDFVVIAASPPCAEYSRAKTVGWRNLDQADRLVQKTLEIVEFFNPKLWWIENPRSGLLVNRKCVSQLPYIDVDYCQFSEWGYQKPTRIWGSENLRKISSRICDGKTCSQMIEGPGGYWRHRERLGGRGMRYSTYQKWRVPEKLVFYILSFGG